MDKPGPHPPKSLEPPVPRSVATRVRSSISISGDRHGHHREPRKRAIGNRMARLRARPLDGAASTSATSSSGTTPPTRATARSWRARPSAPRACGRRLQPLLAEERKKGILDVSQVPSSILAHAPGYIDKKNEIIVGLQTDAPLKRAIMPFGGWRVVAASLESYGYKPDERVGEIFTKYRKTHNDGVFDAYTADIKAARSSGIVTGLPDAYGRGRIIGDYRRVALYGVDFLIAGQAAREEGARRPPLHRGRDPAARGARRADPLAQGAEGDGVELRLRHLQAGGQCPRGGAVDLLRLPRRPQAAERRGDVGRAPLDLLGRLLRARPARGQAHRGPGPGDRRRPRHQVADRALPARAGIQPAVLRRPGLGDRGGGRHGRGRAHARHQERLPHAAHALQPRAGARAQPHRLLVDRACPRPSSASPSRSRSTPARSSTSPTT